MLFFLVAGILAAYHIPLPSTSITRTVFALGLAVLLLLSFLLIRRKQRFEGRWLNGMLLGLALALTGAWLTTEQLHRGRASFAGAELMLIGRVERIPQEREATVRALLQVTPADSLESNSKAVPVLAYFEKDSLATTLQQGDVLVFSGKLNRPSPPSNPGEFDYRSYLRNRGIHYTVFVPSGNWERLGNTAGRTPRTLAANWREKLLSAMREYGLAGENYAVAAAILLGYDELMGEELQQQYVRAGAMHILCVSGLHVGVIFLVLNAVLAFLNKNRWQRLLKTALLLIFIWIYALLTGLSPSVQRAALMLSVFAVGQAVRRDGDPFNTLAVSAFLLLLFDPLLLLNVGFQLSYAAVLGILISYKPVYRLLYLKNKLLDKLWSVTVVSFAAQLGTFPLAAHYFHYFPTFFWLTNLLVFPLSFLVITTGMAFIAFYWLPAVAVVTGRLLAAWVFLLNASVEMVSRLPWHGLHELYFPWLKVWLVYLLLGLAFAMFLRKNIRLLLPLLATVLALLLFQTVRNANLLRQHKLAVYSIKNHSAYDFVSGRNHLLLVDSSLLADTAAREYALQNCRLSWGLDDNCALLEAASADRAPELFFDGRFAAFGSIRLAFVDGSVEDFPELPNKLQLDLVMVSGKEPLNLDRLCRTFDFSQLVLDASVPYWKAKKLEEEAKAWGISCYNVRKNGAFVCDLNRQFKK